MIEQPAERSSRVLFPVGHEELVGGVVLRAVGARALPADHQGSEVLLVVRVDVEVVEAQQAAIVEGALQQRFVLRAELDSRVESFDVRAEWRVDVPNFKL